MRLKKYIAEFIGTLVLVFTGCGTAAAVGTKADFGTGYLLTALAFGLAIVAMAYSIGNVSGCHVNPAVSLAMLINKKIDFADFVGYVIAQFAGATAGAALLLPFKTSDKVFGGLDAGLGANALFNGSTGLSILIEAILTFIFVLAVLGATDKIENSSVSGLVIGLSLTLVHLVGIHFTGTSVNPARSFGPALFAGAEAMHSLWVFIVAPLIGGALAAIVYGFVLKTKKQED